jgi:hypothetical protein
VRHRPRRNPHGPDPGSDVGRVEAHEATDLDVRDAPLGDQSAHVTLSDAQALRERRRVEQRREFFHTDEKRA